MINPQTVISDLSAILTDRITALGTERDTALATAEQQFDALTAANSTLTAQVSSLTAQLAAANAQLGTAPATQLQTLLGQVSALEQQLETAANLAAQLTSLQSELATANATIATQAARITELEAAANGGGVGDPVPPAAPTGLRILSTTDVGGPLDIRLTWDAIPSGTAPVLEYKGAEGNPAGPDSWTPIMANGAGGGSEGGDGSRAALVLQNPAGQSIVFRLRVHDFATALDSEPLEMPFSVPAPSEG